MHRGTVHKLDVFIPQTGMKRRGMRYRMAYNLKEGSKLYCDWLLQWGPPAGRGLV